MGGTGDIRAPALQRLGASIKRRLRDYLDLAPQDETHDVRALTASVDALRARLGATLADRRRLQREYAALVATPDNHAARAEQAIGLGRDDLARAALRHRAEIDARSEALERDLDALSKEAEALEALLGAGAIGDRSLADKLAELDRLLAEHATEKEH